MNLNSITLAGRLGKDPETKFTQDGKAITNFSLCWNDYKKEGHWFNCVVFGKKAEVISEFVQGGDTIGVVGQLQIDSWEDKQTGAKRTAPKIIVQDFSFGAKSKKNEGQPASQKPVNSAPADDEMPF